MVNDYAEIVTTEELDESNYDEGNLKNNEQELPTTTTISTIALQSGDTRLVIALLQVRIS